MFEIIRKSPTQIWMKGQLDAAQSNLARVEFDTLEGECDVHFDELDYISSSGLSILLHTQQRLSKSNGSLTLYGLNPHIRQVFEYAGFDSVFQMK